MRREFEFWALNELDMEACCALKYYPEIDVCRVQKEKEIAENQKVKLEAEEMEYIFGRGKLGRIRWTTWCLELLEVHIKFQIISLGFS